MAKRKSDSYNDNALLPRSLRPKLRCNVLLQLCPKSRDTSYFMVDASVRVVIVRCLRFRKVARRLLL